MTTATLRLEFRCQAGRVHGVKKEYPGGKVFLEIRCRDKRCTDREPNTVVFHYFDWDTGEPTHTQKYRDPIPTAEREAQVHTENTGKVMNQ